MRPVRSLLQQFAALFQTTIAHAAMPAM